MEKFLRSVDETNLIKEIYRLALNRFYIGSYRYGTFKEKVYPRYFGIHACNKKIEAYKRTGNLEFIIDAINCLVIEFIYPGHKDAYFKAEDDKEHV